MESYNQHTVILGAGPAGCACALWLHQLGCSVELIEASHHVGGQQRYSPYPNLWLPGQPSIKGEEVAAALRTQLDDLGITYHTNTNVQHITITPTLLELTLAAPKNITARYVVLATGSTFRTAHFKASDNIAIGPGHQTESKDVKGRHVAILGGGDNAFDQYLFAKQRGAASVSIFARTVRAQQKLRAMVSENDVHLGDHTIDQHTLSVNGTAYDHLFVMYGFEACVPRGLEGLVRTDKGFVQADLWGKTSLANIYAIGEVTQTFHPCVVTSYAHGIQAAKSIHQEIENLLHTHKTSL